MSVLGIVTPLPLAETLSPHARNMMLLWLGILLAVVILGFGALMLFRRRLTEQDAPQNENVGFSLSDLRAMRDRGEITSEEYEATRAKVVASVKRMVNEPPKDKRKMPGDALGDAGTGE
jgi:hypothetical protein